MYQRLCLVLGLTVLLAACGQEAADSAAPQATLRPVVTLTTEAAQSIVYREFSGVVRAELRARLSFRVAGKVERLAVKVGDVVNRQDVIATLNQADYRLELQQAEAARAQAQAEARNTAANYRRIKSLYESETASRTELDNALASNEAAKARVTQTDKQLALVQQRLSYTQLRPTSDGCVVASTDVEVGENISVGTQVATLHCGQASKIETSVAETVIQSLGPGMQVLVQLDALEGQRLRGQISEVGVEAQGTAYPVKVTLSEGQSSVLPGMAAVVYFPMTQPTLDDGVYVPWHVVQAEREQAFVFVVQDQGDGSALLQKVAVTLGPISSGEKLWVQSGLQPGQVIVARGISQLYDGMRVKYLATEVN